MPAPLASDPGNSRRGLFGGRLAVRLMVAIAVFSAVVTMVLTAVQVYLEYHRDIDDLWARVERAAQSILPSVVENTWLLDKNRLTILLDGIVRVPDLVAARVTGMDGEVLATAGAEPDSEALRQSRPLRYLRRGREFDIGTLTLTVTLDDTQQRAYRRAGAILLTTTANVALVALFIYFLVHRLITRHMQGLARYARRLSLTHLDEPLVLDRDEAAWGGDELGDLVGAVNDMRDGLRASYAELRDLTEGLENRVAERTVELREALDLNEKISSKSPFGIIVFDDTGTMIAVNEAAARIAGATIEQMVGLNFHDLNSWRASGLASYADRALRSGTPQHADGVHAVTTFGREIYLDAHFVPFRSGGQSRLLYVFNDVSDIRHAEQALRQSEQRFRDFAEAASQWLWETDAEHRFTSLIGPGLGLIGIDRKDIQGRTRWEIASGRDIARDPEGWARNRDDMENHRPFRNFEYALTAVDGRVTHINISGKPVFDDDGSFLGYRGTGHDVTQRREMEIQLIQASKMATLGEMATGMAHELNQPLNVIRMAAANIGRKAAKGEADDAYLTDKVTKITQNVDRAAAIIDHMRIFGRKEVAVEDVDPRAVVRESLGMIGQQLGLAGIEVSAVLPDACPTVRANTVQLEQVLLNLLANARDALVAGDAADKRIVVEVAPAPAAVVISVRDNGGGVPVALKDRIFEPFFTTKEAGQGTGLGLSISYGIVKEFGGTLTVDNVGDGAAFAVTLPVKRARPGKPSA